MKLYLLNLNGAEAGPFTEKQLRAMWLVGTATVNTEWRQSNNDNWFSGDSLPALLEDFDPATGRTLDGPDQIQRRTAVRDKTAYPFARQLIQGVMVLCLIAAVAIWILDIFFFTDGGVISTALAIGTTLTAAIYSAIALVGLALLDVADCHLKKL